MWRCGNMKKDSAPVGTTRHPLPQFSRNSVSLWGTVSGQCAKLGGIMKNIRRVVAIAAIAVGIAAFQGTAYAQQTLREQSQNPIADLITVPFQNNTNFGVGQLNKTQNIHNIQPVIPIQLNENWNLIARTIVPVTYQPAMFRGDSTDFGLGDATPQLFFSPKKPAPFMGGVFVWGVGPNFLLKTATDRRLGTGKWGAGPTAVALAIVKPFVVGAVVGNTWSFAGDSDREDVNLLVAQYFINYNLPQGWFLTSSPVITANWEADSDERWTVPIGGGFGRVFNIGQQPVNAQVQAFSNVVTPDNGGANWQLRAQLNFLFPQK